MYSWLIFSLNIDLLEMFSTGGTPYPDLPMNELFYSALKTGYRMPKPAQASDEVWVPLSTCHLCNNPSYLTSKIKGNLCCLCCSYDIMRKCWDEKFEKRPEFSFLVHSVGNMLTDSYKKVFCLKIATVSRPVELCYFCGEHGLRKLRHISLLHCTFQFHI